MNNIYKCIIFVFTFGLFNFSHAEEKIIEKTAPTAAAETKEVKKAHSPIGIWWTKDKKAKVELYENGSTMDGKIIWLKEPDENGKPKIDGKNPDEKLRARPILNLVFLTGFQKPSDPSEATWDGGLIYDAESGNTYKAWIKVIDENNLKLRGYKGISLFGRTEEWTKVTE